MPQRVFEIAVSGVTAAHYSVGTNRSEVASEIWSGYADLLADDPLQTVSEIVEASESSSEMLERMAPTAGRSEHLRFLRHFLWFCGTFDDFGKRRRRRIFDGLRHTPPNRTGKLDTSQN